MASYLGNSPETTLKVRATSYRYIATAGQTTFNATDSNGLSLIINLGDVEVFLNGVMLDQTDYTYTNTSITLSAGATADDIIEIITNVEYATANVYSKEEVDVKVSGAITDLVGTAGSALNTLGELSDALGDDANYAATITTALGNKANSSDVTTALAAKVSKTSSTGSAQIPVGSTAERNESPTQGDFRFNSTTNSFEGYNGTAWGAVGGGATGGAGNAVFYENDQTVSVNYSITTGKNAMTAGPVTIADGVEVTIPDGSTWTIV